jgi:hypothetical protein
MSDKPEPDLWPVQQYDSPCAIQPPIQPADVPPAPSTQHPEGPPPPGRAFPPYLLSQILHPATHSRLLQASGSERRWRSSRASALSLAPLTTACEQPSAFADVSRAGDGRRGASLGPRCSLLHSLLAGAHSPPTAENLNEMNVRIFGAGGQRFFGFCVPRQRG